MMKKHDIVGHSYIKIKERKLKNKFIRNIIAICILLGIVLLILIFSQFEKKENKNIVEDLMYDDGQQIYIDDYTITLERLVYESRTKQGKLVISVKREGGDMNDEYITTTNPATGFAFGEGGRFRFFFYLPKGGCIAPKVEIKKEKNVMYIYYDFNIESESSEFDNKIYIYDKESGRKKGQPDSASVFFELKSQVDSKKYIYTNSNKEYIIDLSPFSILIESKEKIENIEKIEVLYKNGNSKDIIKNGKLIDCETCVDKGNNQYILVFRDILDLDEIEFLNFNNVKLVEK